MICSTHILVALLSFISTIGLSISTILTKIGAQNHELTIVGVSSIPSELSWCIYLAFTTITSSIVSQLISMTCMHPSTWNEVAKQMNVRKKEFKWHCVATISRFTGTFCYFLSFLVLQVNEIAVMSGSQLFFHNLMHMIFRKRYPNRWEVLGFSMLGFGILCLAIPEYANSMSSASPGARNANQLTIGIVSLQVGMALFGFADYILDHLHETITLYAVSMITSLMLFILFLLSFFTQMLLSMNELASFWPDWLWIGSVNGQTLMFYFISYMFAVFNGAQNLMTFLILHRLYVIAALLMDLLVLDTEITWMSILGAVLVTTGCMIATASHRNGSLHSSTVISSSSPTQMTEEQTHTPEYKLHITVHSAPSSPLSPDPLDPLAIPSMFPATPLRSEKSVSFSVRVS